MFLDIFDRYIVPFRTSEGKIERKVLIGFFCFFAIFISFLGVLAQIYNGNYQNILFFAFVVIFFLTCSIFNHKGYTVIIGYVMSYGGALIIVFMSLIFGFERNILIYFLPLIAVNYFLLDYSNRLMLFTFLLIPACYIALEFTYDLSPFILQKISKDQIKVEIASNILFSLLMASVFIHYILKDAFKNEKSLNIALEKGALQNKELTKKNEELDRFVYSVSHDLRAPVATLKGLSNLISEEKNTETINYFNQLQLKSLLKLDLYIKDILSYYASNRLNLVVEKIDFDKIVNVIIDRYEFEINSSHIKLDTNIASFDDFYSDNYHLRLIFNNIISNTIKYFDTQKQEKLIKIKIKKNASSVQIVIWDNGLGIEKEDISQIFTMFHKSEITSSSSGLGMYIVKECVEKLEGKIELNSEKNIFTEVKIELPDLKHLI